MFKKILPYLEKIYIDTWIPFVYSCILIVCFETNIREIGLGLKLTLPKKEWYTLDDLRGSLEINFIFLHLFIHLYKKYE